ncbi:hypothetical protein K431DRAFT_19477 [Polychaeton citri CBS 116435]|uniref:Uncharacterized protein n=1 Tax=Polychaeton citri CBS 116435 TaxID=1314669 RepID=A0A9P4PYI4_9PEZI|nr:hypothetical protein K431DRAFT_19477 [Polychaeton citri CBS 116435]
MFAYVHPAITQWALLSTQPGMGQSSAATYSLQAGAHKRPFRTIRLVVETSKYPINHWVVLHPYQHLQQHLHRPGPARRGKARDLISCEEYSSVIATRVVFVQTTQLHVHGHVRLHAQMQL